MAPKQNSYDGYIQLGKRSGRKSTTPAGIVPVEESGPTKEHTSPGGKSTASSITSPPPKKVTFASSGTDVEMNAVQQDAAAQAATAVAAAKAAAASAAQPAAQDAQQQLETQGYRIPRKNLNFGGSGTAASDDGSYASTTAVIRTCPPCHACLHTWHVWQLHDTHYAHGAERPAIGHQAEPEKPHRGKPSAMRFTEKRATPGSSWEKYLNLITTLCTQDLRQRLQEQHVSDTAVVPVCWEDTVDAGMQEGKEQPPPRAGAGPVDDEATEVQEQASRAAFDLPDDHPGKMYVHTCCSHTRVQQILQNVVRIQVDRPRQSG